MDRTSLEWFETLAKALIWAAGVVLLLSVIAAVSIAGSDSSLPFSEDVEREGRGIAAIGAIAAGLLAAGLLSGLGAILRLMVRDRLDRLGSASESDAPATTAAAVDPGDRPPPGGAEPE